MGMNVKNLKIGVVGTGLMGANLAVLLAGNRFKTVVLGVDEENNALGYRAARESLMDLVKHNVIREAYAEECLGRLSYTTEYVDLSDMDFVFEAVPERVDVKGQVFCSLEAVCSRDCVFISVTSGLMPQLLEQQMRLPSRLIVAHAWNPPHLIPLVEVVPGLHTSRESLSRTLELLAYMERKVVVLKKAIPGFIGNRIMHAMYREALHLIEEGVATAQEIDTTIFYSFGQRFASVGVLEYFDSCGLDLQISVQSYLLSELCDAKQPQKPLKECVEHGELGPKTGKGVYDWKSMDIENFRFRKSRPFFQYVNWDRGMERGLKE